MRSYFEAEMGLTYGKMQVPPKELCVSAGRGCTGWDVELWVGWSHSTVTRSDTSYKGSIYTNIFSPKLHGFVRE